MAETNALMGMARVMKPFWRFEYWYDRTTDVPLGGNVPIALFPTGDNIPANGDPPEVDPRAFDVAAREGLTGYATNLAAMLPMPAIGSEVLVWLPHISDKSGNEQSNCYLYVPVWRLRSVADLLRYSLQGNVIKESFGTPDTTGGSVSQRYIMPGSMGHALLGKQEFDEQLLALSLPTFMQPSVSLRDGIAMPTAYTTTIRDLPLSPTGGIVAYEQGILDPAASNCGDRPSFKPHWLKVKGNELGFWVYKIRYPTTSDTELTYVDWDFNYDPNTGFCDNSAEDFWFSHFFGVGASLVETENPGEVGLHPESGVYVMTGVTSG